MTTTLKNRFLIVVIIALLITNLAMLFILTGQRRNAPKMTGDKSRGGMAIFLKDKIGFSEAQLKTFDGLRNEHHEDIRELFDSLRNSKRIFYNQLPKGTVDDSIGAKIGTRQVTLEMSFFQYFEKVRGLCTPSQRPVFDSLFPAVIERMIAPTRRFGKYSGEKSTEDSTSH